MTQAAPQRTLITVAPTGAETAKSDMPALPVTLDELVATAKACEAAGAALVHVHIRDAEARPTLDLARLRDTVAALRQSTSRNWRRRIRLTPIKLSSSGNSMRALKRCARSIRKS